VKQVLVCIALAALAACGQTTTPAISAAPEPAATITQQVTTTATATTTVTNATAPAICLTALADADAMIQVFQDTMAIVADAFTAASRNDVTTVLADNAKMNAQSAKIKANPYAADSAACRAAK